MPTKQKIALILLLVVVMLTAVTLILAQTSANFDLTWNVLGNGGSPSTSASYQVNGTIGQDLSSPPRLNSAGYQVSSGYWVLGSNGAIYLPVVYK